MAIQVQLCIGSDCRKKRKRIRRLRALFSDVVDVTNVKCQDICSGPVVVVHRSHERFWFSKVRSKRSRRDLIGFILGDELGDHLKGRLVKRKVDKTKVHGLRS